MDCSYGRASFGAFLVSLLRVWLESGIPPTLSVVGVRSALSPPLQFSGSLVLRSGRNTCTAGAAAYQWAGARDDSSSELIVKYNH